MNVMFCIQQFIINFELVQMLAAAITSQTCVLHEDLCKKASLQLPPFHFFGFLDSCPIFFTSRPGLEGFLK